MFYQAFEGFKLGLAASKTSALQLSSLAPKRTVAVAATMMVLAPMEMASVAVDGTEL